MYKVVIGRQARKNLKKLPAEVVQLARMLTNDLEKSGPEQPSWKNYSKLGRNKYHCHLTYHYVACWTNENGTLTIEVYYVGSRQNSPY